MRGVVNEEIYQAVSTRLPPFSGRPPYLALFCGSLVPGKGASLIPEIAKPFKDRIRFFIAGNGPLQSQLEVAARNCGGDVTCVGYLSNQELYKLYGSADLLINPYDDEPSGGILPFKLVEYLAAGGVVVSTRADNQKKEELFDYCQVTQPNIYDLTEALEYVLAHPDDSAERARRGQLWAISNYSENVISKELDKLISYAASLLKN